MLDYVKMDSNTDPQGIIDAMHRAKVVQLDALVEYIKRLEQDKAELLDELILSRDRVTELEVLLSKLEQR